MRGEEPLQMKMSIVKRNTLMLRWSLLTAGLIALFWTIYYLVAGEVPATSKIVWVMAHGKQEEIATILPFAISRWWDILIGPIFMPAIIFLATKVKKEDMVIGLIVGLGFGLVARLVFGLVFGLDVGLSVGLGLGLVIGLVIGRGVIVKLLSRIPTFFPKVRNFFLANDKK